MNTIGVFDSSSFIAHTSRMDNVHTLKGRGEGGGGEGGEGEGGEGCK